MIVARAILIFFAKALVFSTLASGQAVIEDQISLTTPEAPWTVSINGKALYPERAQVKDDGTGAYFLMKDHKDGLTVSVFIERVDKCKTSEECRDFVLNTGNPAWGKYQDLAKSKIGDFSYFEFYRPEAGGQPLQMLDMHAQYVGGGFWVDLHISKVQYKKEEHALFENLVKAVKFIPKATESSADPKQPINLARASVENWLKLWDAAKCKETYGSLSTLSRSAVEEKQWVEYCEAGNKSLGRLKSRQLIATSLTKSLPSKPDHSGATLRYRSTFENGGPIVEFVSLVLERNGNWTVANYLTQ